MATLDIWGNQTGQALAIWGPYADDGGWLPYASYREKAGGHWRDPVLLSDDKPAAEDSVLQWSGMTGVVYPSGSALVLWSDGRRIFTRALGVIE